MVEKVSQHQDARESCDIQKKTQVKNEADLSFNRRARNHWDLLRKSLRKATKAVREAEEKEVQLFHGFYHHKSFNLQRPATQVLHIAAVDEFLVCDGHRLSLLDGHGQERFAVPAMDNVDRAVLAPQANRVVAWAHGHDKLYLLNRDLVVVNQARAAGSIWLAVYNKSRGELITVGPNFITFWMFRYGARHLVARKTVETTFCEPETMNIAVLEESSSWTQKMFCAHLKGVVVFNAYSGVELKHKRELHTSQLTALTFYNPLMFFITGAKDGTIKVWDEDWQVKMIFVGHSDEVNFLRIHLHGSAFISSSRDGTLRVWSLETNEESDRCHLGGAIKGMGAVQRSGVHYKNKSEDVVFSHHNDTNQDFIYTYSSLRVDIWKLQHLYHITTRIGQRVQKIKVTDHPLFPQRAVVMCTDSTVHIVCPSNGEVLTTLVVRPDVRVIDAALATAQDTLFVVMCSGDIVKSSTSKNPCHVLSVWKTLSSQEACKTILVYEFIGDPNAPSDVWHLSRNRRRRPELSARNQTLLIGGLNDGHVCVFDWFTGKVTFRAKAHNLEVHSLTSNTKQNQLISAGMDKIIKIWRVFPFTQEALTPLMSFYCGSCPALLTMVKSSLGVVFQDPSTATFSVTVYDLKENERFDHSPELDHIDQVTGFTSCPQIKFFASSSRDGTIRIWDENNTLIRLLRLNTEVHSISFCSPRGDLLVGLATHLYHIPFFKYLPTSYLRRQVCMKFASALPELPFPLDETELGGMAQEDVQRVKNCRAAIRPHSERIFLSHEVEQKNPEDIVVRDEVIRHLQERERELQQLRDGTFKAKHVQARPRQSSAFEKYLKIFYNNLRPPVSIEQLESLLELKFTESQVATAENKFHPDEALYGFFSGLGLNIKKDHSLSESRHPFPWAHTGSLPNSVLLSLVASTETSTRDFAETLPYQPPRLTDKQLAEIDALYKWKRADQYFDDSELLMSRTGTLDEDRLHTAKSDDRQHEIDRDSRRNVAGKVVKSDGHADTSLSESSDEATFEPPGPDLSEAGPARVSLSSDVSIFQDLDTVSTPKTASVKDHTGKKEKESCVLDLDRNSAQPSTLMAKFQEIMSRTPKREEEVPLATEVPLSIKKDKASPTPSKPIVKLISRPLPLGSQSKPRPLGDPVPECILRFVQASWFQKYLPEFSQNGATPPPWTTDSFVNKVCQMLSVMDAEDLVSATQAIQTISMETGLSTRTKIMAATTLVELMSQQKLSQTGLGSQHQAFLMVGLKTLVDLRVKEKRVVVGMMVLFLTGDPDVRSAVLDSLARLGLFDPHQQLEKELNSWDVWAISQTSLSKELQQLCHVWLEKWFTLYELRNQDSSISLRGESNQHAMKPTLVRAGNRDNRAEKPGSQESNSLLEGVDYLEVVNYFCDVMTEKDLAALKREATESVQPNTRLVPAKNTVVVLPRIQRKPALVRLGETHTSQCRPERETVFHVPHSGLSVLPGLPNRRSYDPGELNAFVSFINLPMKRVYLNPFCPSSNEKLTPFYQPSLITLKSSQKYFFPSMSYIPSKDVF